MITIHMYEGNFRREAFPLDVKGENKVQIQTFPNWTMKTALTLSWNWYKGAQKALKKRVKSAIMKPRRSSISVPPGKNAILLLFWAASLFTFRKLSYTTASMYRYEEESILKGSRRAPLVVFSWCRCSFCSFLYLLDYCAEVCSLRVV